MFFSSSNIVHSEVIELQATFFTMIEDWKLEEISQGTRLTKSWRDIHKQKMKFLPMGLIVRKSARAESRKLKAAWDKLA